MSTLPNEGVLERHVPANAYSGKLYVLTDGLTFSAGIAYITSVNYHLRQQNRFVKFIGDEPAMI